MSIYKNEYEDLSKKRLVDTHRYTFALFEKNVANLKISLWGYNVTTQDPSIHSHNAALWLGSVRSWLLLELEGKNGFSYERVHHPSQNYSEPKLTKIKNKWFGLLDCFSKSPSKDFGRYPYANQLLELIRKAMELRKPPTRSWSGADIWRARDDHSPVELHSKLKLEDRSEAMP